MYNVYPQQQAIAAVAARYLIYVHILWYESTNKKKGKKKKYRIRIERKWKRWDHNTYFLKGMLSFFYIIYFALFFYGSFPYSAGNSFFFFFHFCFVSFLLPCCRKKKNLYKFSIYMFIFLSYWNDIYIKKEWMSFWTSNQNHGKQLSPKIKERKKNRNPLSVSKKSSTIRRKKWNPFFDLKTQ